MITFHQDQFRLDYEIRDHEGKCRGFIWRHQEKWVCRVDEHQAKHLNTLAGAKLEALVMVGLADGRRLVQSAKLEEAKTRLCMVEVAIRKEPQRWRQASLVLDWVRREIKQGMPPADAIRLAREHSQIGPSLIDNAARAANDNLGGFTPPNRAAPR